MRQVFATVLRRSIREGLVGGKGFVVHASLIRAEPPDRKGSKATRACRHRRLVGRSTRIWRCQRLSGPMPDQERTQSMLSSYKPRSQLTTNANVRSGQSARKPSTLLIIEDALGHSAVIRHIAGKVGFMTVKAISYACKVLARGSSTASRSTSGSANTSDSTCSVTSRRSDAGHRSSSSANPTRMRRYGQPRESARSERLHVCLEADRSRVASRSVGTYPTAWTAVKPAFRQVRSEAMPR